MILTINKMYDISDDILKQYISENGSDDLHDFMDWINSDLDNFCVDTDIDSIDNSFNVHLKFLDIITDFKYND